MFVAILLIFIGLYFFARHYLSDKKRPNNCKSMPLAKDYDNFYRFISDLDEWNDKIYLEYLRDCEKKGRIPIDKEIINRDLEVKKAEIKNLFRY